MTSAEWAQVIESVLSWAASTMPSTKKKFVVLFIDSLVSDRHGLNGIFIFLNSERQESGVPTGKGGAKGKHFLSDINEIYILLTLLNFLQLKSSLFHT